MATVPPVVLYQGTADTVFEALRKITTIAPRKLYLAHLRVLIIGESLAKEGIGRNLELFYRDQELRPDFYVAIAKGTTAEDTLKVLTGLEPIPASKIFHTLETSQKVWAPTLAVTLDDLVNRFESDTNTAVLTGIRVNGDPTIGESPKNVTVIDSPTRLQLYNLAVFKGDKLVGWLSEDESKGYNYIMNNVKSTVGFVPCPDEGKIVNEVIRSKAEIKGITSKGTQAVRILIRPMVNLAAVQCKINLLDPQTIAYDEKKVEEVINGYIDKVLHKAQKNLHADIFGFGEAISRSDPKAWSKLKKNWDEIFPELPVQVQVQVRIRNIGTTNKSYLNDIKE
ncbi:spore germination protein KC [Paenibacillus sp. yr247]|uniref:Ger(x)C family spore germination protein n=1 Tax=Paenibacillus sp. yr247 TaxID=1761880 RepID=UPI00088772D5|nr:Ger(x)C family spore germination protein [Paenibacillus sp. yr247]SDN66953.1 spore germination protein KC [Paenibacillus sp. yr247]